MSFEFLSIYRSPEYGCGDYKIRRGLREQIQKAPALIVPLRGCNLPGDWRADLVDRFREYGIDAIALGAHYVTVSGEIDLDLLRERLRQWMAEPVHAA